MSKTKTKSFQPKVKTFLSLPAVQVCLALLLILLLRFFPFLQGQTLFFGDNYSLMVPGKMFTTHWLRQGILPLWNPTIFAGLPWIGDVNQSVLYPSTLLFLIFHPAIALNLTIVLHVILAFVGMYLVSKKLLNHHLSSLVAAAIWTISTQITVVFNNISALQSLVWMPLVVYLGLLIQQSFNKKLLFALVIFLQFAGGYPIYVIYSILLAVLISLLEKSKTLSLKKWFFHWLSTAVMTIAFSAIIWLPFMELLTNSTRTIQSSDQALVGSLHPLELIKIVIPYFFEQQSRGIRWGPGWNALPNVFVYFGWVGLFTLSWFFFKIKKQKKDLCWLILFFLTIIFSLGSYFPINLSFLIGPTRVPSTALIITSFMGALLVAKYIFQVKVKKTYILLGTIVFAISALLLILVRTNFFELWHIIDNLLRHRLLNSPFHTIEKNRLIVSTILESLLINVGLFTIGIWLLKRKQYLLLTLVLVFDLLINTQGLMFFAPSHVYPQTSSEFIFQQQLQTDFQHRTLIRNHNAPYTDLGAYSESVLVRQPFSDSYIDALELRDFNYLKRMSQGMTPDWNMVTNVNIINGYTTLMPTSFNTVWNENAFTNPAINNLPEIKTDNELLADWSVKYYLVDHWFRHKTSFSDYSLMSEQEYWGLYTLPALKRFRFLEETLANQNEPEFELHLTQDNFVETPNTIQLSFNNTQDHSALIIADRYDPNWQAVVNDQIVELTEYNQMRLIPIQPGLNKIELVYHPRLFYWGAITSGISLFLSVIILAAQSLISHTKYHTPNTT